MYKYLLNFFQKPIDKSLPMWYNIITAREKENSKRKERIRMKATGIVRRVDDLGRVVIPREMRKQLGIREGEPLEIYLGETADGHPMVCFTKYFTSFENNLRTITDQITNGLESYGEYELSTKFRNAIKEAAKILDEFENRG